MLKDSFEFVNNISKMKNKNGFMISFDVESLLTNIPVDETIDLLVKMMYKKKSKSTDLFHGLKELEFRKMMN